MSRSRSTKRAETLEEDQLQQFRIYLLHNSRTFARDNLFTLLSFRAGLRAKEIAGLRLRNVTDARGHLSDKITIYGDISKGGYFREIPMHPEIREAIGLFLAEYSNVDWFAVSPRQTRGPMSADAVVQWFYKTFREAGFQRCSSHSGRRSFITHLARAAPLNGCSLADVQRMVGHARLETTQDYIAASPWGHRMVRSLGSYGAATPLSQLGVPDRTLAPMRPQLHANRQRLLSNLGQPGWR
jgi:integrase/recombinase XerD